MASNSNRGTSGQSPTNLQRFLKGADYPASKEDLMQLAENNGAPEEILDLFASMPDVDFDGVTDVQECYSHIIGEEEEEEEEEETSDEKTHSKSENSRSKKENTRSQSSRQNNDDATEKERQDDIEEARKKYEERKQKREKEQKEDDDGWDHRLKGHETPALKDSREMKHGYDGRGRVTNEETDHRLKGNETPALKDSREMKHGYDGRGRVRKMGNEIDETISDDRERYEERKSGREQEIDPETGSHSRRQKDDAGNLIRGGRETFMEWREKHRQNKTSRQQSQGTHGKAQSRDDDEESQSQERTQKRKSERPTWSEFAGKSKK